MKNLARKLMAMLFAFALSASSAVALNPAAAFAEDCPTFDFSTLFYDDYNSGVAWASPGEKKTITWSTNSESIYDEVTARPFTVEEEAWVVEAVKGWDDVLSNITFQKTDNGSSAEIAIGWVTLTSAERQTNATAYWNGWGKNGIRNKGTIKLRVTAPFLAKREGVIHAVQHEVGNVLGLGDIKPNSAFESKQEDPWQEPYGQATVSDFDAQIIRQLYGESTCLSTLRVPSVTPTPTPSVTPTTPAAKVTFYCLKGSTLKKLSASVAKCPTGYKLVKPITITCVKGNLTKKVTAVNAKCPTGYRLK
jgi:hypothetical protein